MNAISNFCLVLSCVLLCVLFSGCSHAAPPSVRSASGDAATALLEARSPVQLELLTSTIQRNKRVKSWTIFYLSIADKQHGLIEVFGLRDPQAATPRLFRLQYPAIFRDGKLIHSFDVVGIGELPRSLWIEDYWYPQVLCDLEGRPRIFWCQGSLRGHGEEVVAVRYDPRPTKLLSIAVKPDYPGNGITSSWSIQEGDSLVGTTLSGPKRCYLVLGDSTTGEFFNLPIVKDGIIDMSGVPKRLRHCAP
jgi:hypothetical protein